MPSRSTPITLRYFAYDTNNKVGKTGDVANHTIRIQLDNGTPALPTATPVEVNGTVLPGWYEVDLLGSETNCNTLLLGGKSSTSGVVVQGTQVTFEAVPLTSAEIGTQVWADENAQMVISDLQGIINGQTEITSNITGLSSPLTTIQNSVNALSSLTTAQIVAAIQAMEIETGFSFQTIMKYVAAFVAGLTNGGGTEFLTFRNLNDTVDRIKFTLDKYNNRTTVQRDNL
jgi:hypothetical protein